MDEPKLTTVIEYNGELFREGDIVNLAIDCGFNYEDKRGRIVEINKNETLKFDCSEQCNSKIKVTNIERLVSISHAAEQEEQMDQLRPCPFCGGKAKISLFLSRYGVTCTECMGAVLSAPGMDKAEIVKAWNKREPIEKIAEQLMNEKQDDSHSITYENDIFIHGYNSGLGKAYEIVKTGGKE